MYYNKRNIVALCCFVVFTASASRGAMVPFVIPAQQDPNSVIAQPYEPIDVNDERIIVVGDKSFGRSPKRLANFI